MRCTNLPRRPPQSFCYQTKVNGLLIANWPLPGSLTHGGNPKRFYRNLTMFAANKGMLSIAPLPALASPDAATRIEEQWCHRLIIAPIWLALFALIIGDTIWLLATKLRLSYDGFPLLPWLATLLACAWGSARLPHASRIRILCEGGLFMLIAWPALRLFNHLTMTTAFPLADAQLASIDAAMAFDWHAYLAWFDRHPILLNVMDFLYTSLSTYSAALYIAIAMLSRKPATECAEFIGIFFLTAVACCLIGQFFSCLVGSHILSPVAWSLRIHQPPRRSLSSGVPGCIARKHELYPDAGKPAGPHNLSLVSYCDGNHRDLLL